MAARCFKTALAPQVTITWYPVTDEADCRELEVAVPDDSVNYRWVLVSDSCPIFRDLYAVAKGYVLHVAEVQQRKEQLKLATEKMHAQRKEAEHMLVTVENVMRQDVTRSQVRAGFARGVITEEQVAQLRLVEAFLLPMSRKQQATLQLLKAHEHALLSVERGIARVLTNGQVFDLVAYSLTHTRGNKIRYSYGRGLVELLMARLRPLLLPQPCDTLQPCAARPPTARQDTWRPRGKDRRPTRGATRVLSPSPSSVARRTSSPSSQIWRRVS